MIEKDVNYGLIVAFPDESENFVHGFEAGGIWEQMKNPMALLISITTHTKNREVISRMAISKGWTIKVIPTAIDGWDQTDMEKTTPEPKTANPHGLRIVSTQPLT